MIPPPECSRNWRHPPEELDKVPRKAFEIAVLSHDKFKKIQHITSDSPRTAQSMDVQLTLIFAKSKFNHWRYQNHNFSQDFSFLLTILFLLPDVGDDFVGLAASR